MTILLLTELHVNRVSTLFLKNTIRRCAKARKEEGKCVRLDKDPRNDYIAPKTEAVVSSSGIAIEAVMQCPIVAVYWTDNQRTTPSSWSR